MEKLTIATSLRGHFLSLKHQEIRVANDPFQGTADVAHRPRKVTKSPKRSLKDSRCQQASRADRMSAGQRIKLGLPTQS
jgi:ribosomal protein L20